MCARYLCFCFTFYLYVCARYLCVRVTTFYLRFCLLRARPNVAAREVRMIYFKSLTIKLRYCCLYLPFLQLMYFYIAAQPVRVDRINEGFLGLLPCTEYTRLGYCFSFLCGTSPIFDVYFIKPLSAERRLPKFERNKFILALRGG